MSNVGITVESTCGRKESAKRNRDISVDMLRVFACCAVVGLHTFGKDSTSVSAALYYACGFAVPVFFITSGAFLLNRGKVSWQYSLRRVWRLACIVLLWVGLATGARAVGTAVLAQDGAALMLWPQQFLDSLIGTFTQSGLLPQLWFLWALAIVYLLLPLFSRLQTRGKTSLFVVLLVVGFAIQISSCTMRVPWEAYVPQVLRVWIWSKYFLLGGLLYRQLSRASISCTFASSLVAATTIIAVAWQMYAGNTLIAESGGRAHAEFFYDSIIYVAWTSMLLMWAKAANPISTVWVNVSSLTTGVYVVHQIVLRVCSHFLNFNDPVIGSGLGFAVVLMLSFLLVAVLWHTKLFDTLCRV